VVLIGDDSDSVISEMKRELRSKFEPNRVLAGAAAGLSKSGDSPLLKDRDQVDGKSTAYVCENYACKLPVTSAAEMREQLGLI
jgi:uncharacterized protein YyaL (SSP411 family)